MTSVNVLIIIVASVAGAFMALVLGNVFYYFVCENVSRWWRRRRKG